jgi:hypothetical protein
MHGSFANFRTITCKCGRTEETLSRNKKLCTICILKRDLSVKDQKKSEAA